MRNHPSLDETMGEILRDRAEAEAYLDVALEEYAKDGDYAAFLVAIRRVVEAQGSMSALARETELNRRNLYDALSGEGRPRLETVGAILKSLGFRLSITRLA